MAHGRKKWVYAVDTPGGRIKRSRHRTVQDKLGGLINTEMVRRHERAKTCELCVAELGDAYWCFRAECRRCREEEVARRRAGYDSSVWLHHAPKYFRQILQRKFRAGRRHLIINERYDELSRAPRDAARQYW